VNYENHIGTKRSVNRETSTIIVGIGPASVGRDIALKQNNLAGSKKLVGFDTSPALVEGLKRGEIQALVAQNPKKMGREGVEALVAKMKGETVHAVIDSGAAVVTKENLGTPEIQALLVQTKRYTMVLGEHHRCIEGTRFLFQSVNSVSNS
jgi:ABC-type sugar transport system substrate-binding protein